MFLVLFDRYLRSAADNGLKTDFDERARQSLSRHSSPMTEKLTLHIVDQDCRARGELVRSALQHGHQAFGYDDLESLYDRVPHEGLVVISLLLLDGRQTAVIDEMARAGVWLPVIATAKEPAVPAVVDTMRAGVMAVLCLPLDIGRYGHQLSILAQEGAVHMASRRRLAEARKLLQRLTRREREVLESLTDGRSNKKIARLLNISPRTVEVHRANMMGKLGAHHPADAVRTRIRAQV